MARERIGVFQLSDSDGCTILSAPYQKLTGKQLRQRICCDAHDEHYWYGGSHEQRLKCDQELRDCVAALGDTKIERVAFWCVGQIMYYAVRVGGSPKLPTPWRWRKNVPFELEDVKSGYKPGGVDLDEERELEWEWIYDHFHDDH